jgi:hypothetical protein
VEIELVQAIEGRVPDTEALGSREGVSHIAYRVDGLEAAKADAAQAGLKPVCAYHSDYVDFAFYSGPDLGGLLLQFVQFHAARK